MMEYSEHEGRYRQLAFRIGDKKNWYALIMKINNVIKKLFKYLFIMKLDSLTQFPELKRVD